jgi:hypothetical protein
VKIICGLGTAFRFGIVCLALGAGLGFFLGVSSHPAQPSGQVASGRVFGSVRAATTISTEITTTATKIR